MMINLPPLLNRTNLLPGESLASLFERLAELNHFDSSYPLYQVCHESLQRHGLKDREIWCPTLPETLDVVSALVTLDPLVLYRATVQRFAPIITSPDQELEHITLVDATKLPLLSKHGTFKQLLTTRATKYCPLCLREHRHHKITWDVLAITVCLRHGCILLHRCHVCSKPLSVKSVVRAKCTSCSSDLKDANPISVAEDHFGLLSQQEIYSWMMHLESRNSHFQVCDLNLQPQVLYRFIDGICATLITRNLGDYMHKVNGNPVNPKITEVKAKRRIAPVELYGLYATAMKILMNWPESFYEFLDIFTSHRPRKNSSGLHIEFGSLYRNWIKQRWNHPEFSFVQDAFIEYLQMNKKLFRARGRANRYQQDSSMTDLFVTQAIPLREAATELGINPSRVKQLVEEGILRRYGDWKDGPGWHKLIVKEDVLNLKRQLEEFLTIKEAASKLGVSVNFMRTLSKSGLIEPEIGRHVATRRGTLFSSEDIERFWLSVAGSAKITVGEKDGFIDLFHAARILTVIGVNSVGILKLIWRGEISTNLLKDQQTVSGLRFDLGELTEYISKVRSERGWLTRSDVAERFEVSLRQVSKWISEGKLEVDLTHGTTKYIYQDQVIGIASRLFENSDAQLLPNSHENGGTHK